MLKRIALALALALLALPAMAGTQVRTVTASKVDAQGNVSAAIGQKWVKLANGGVKAWTFAQRFVVWSGRDGSGGYENEGMSLRVFDVQKSSYLKVMSEYVMVEQVRYALSETGNPALIVDLVDGGLGLPRVAVVDIFRGEVAVYVSARVADVKGGKLSVQMLNQKDFEEGNYEHPRVLKTAVDSLDALLKGKVIVNRRSGP